MNDGWIKSKHRPHKIAAYSPSSGMTTITSVRTEIMGQWYELTGAQYYAVMEILNNAKKL